MREVVYTLTLEYDPSSEGWQKSVKSFMEETGKTAFDFEDAMKEQFKDSLQEHLQGELGPEGIRVTVDHYEE